MRSKRQPLKPAPVNSELKFESPKGTALGTNDIYDPKLDSLNKQLQNSSASPELLMAALQQLQALFSQFEPGHEHVIKELHVLDTLMNLLSTEDLDVLNNVLVVLTELTFQTNNFSYSIVSRTMALIRLGNKLYGMSNEEFFDKCTTIKH